MRGEKQERNSKYTVFSILNNFTDKTGTSPHRTYPAKFAPKI